MDSRIPGISKHNGKTKLLNFSSHIIGFDMQSNAPCVFSLRPFRNALKAIQIESEAA